MTARIEHRLHELGIDLPTAPAPAGSYVPVNLFRSYAVTAGMLPLQAGHILHPGRLGAELGVAEGQAAATLAVLNALAAIRDTVGTLDKITQIVRVDGFVAATPEFRDHPAVLNGASDLLVEVFGDAGRHTRTAIGVASLPLGAAVELSLWVQL